MNNKNCNTFIFVISLLVQFERILSELICPVGSVQIGELNADIGGCGLEACDDRYDKNTITECRDHCISDYRCKSFTFAPIGGEQAALDKTVCTIYDSNIKNQIWGSNQILCGLLKCPSGTIQIGAINADIAGCGLQECQNRFDKNTIEQCKQYCLSNIKCKSFTWEILSDNSPVCTIYNANTPNSIWNSNQIFCKPLDKSYYITDKKHGKSIICGDIYDGKIYHQTSNGRNNAKWIFIESNDNGYFYICDEKHEQCIVAGDNYDGQIYHQIPNGRDNAKWRLVGTTPNCNQDTILSPGCNYQIFDKKHNYALIAGNNYDGKIYHQIPNGRENAKWILTATLDQTSFVPLYKDIGGINDYFVTDKKHGFSIIAGDNYDGKIYEQIPNGRNNAKWIFKETGDDGWFYICDEKHDHCIVAGDNYDGQIYHQTPNGRKNAKWRLVGTTSCDEGTLSSGCNYEIFDKYHGYALIAGDNYDGDIYHQTPSGRYNAKWILTPTDHSAQFSTNDVTKFAPLLKFDRAASNYGYPMNAQTYINNGVIDSSNENRVLDQQSNPTYWRASTCDGISIKILYWWWYGNQYDCILDQGGHIGDWERIMVHISIITGKIQAVTFWQHSGFYTAYLSEIEISNGNHPVVYVGKIGHGSYYDINGFGGGCGYFYDFRDPEDSNDYLYSWNNLINLDTSNDDWIINGLTWRQNGDTRLRLQTTNPLTHISNSDAMCTIDGCDDTGCNYRQCDSTNELIWTSWNCIAAHSNSLLIDHNNDFYDDDKEQLLKNNKNNKRYNSIYYEDDKYHMKISEPTAIIICGLLTMLLIFNIIICYFKGKNNKQKYSEVKYTDSDTE